MSTNLHIVVESVVNPWRLPIRSSCNLATSVTSNKTHLACGNWLDVQITLLIICDEEVMMFSLNTLRPRQKGRRFADDTFKRIFLNENVRISIEISLKFVPKGPTNDIPALVQMAWRRSGDKPLSEPMMVSLLYIYSDAYMRHSASMS